MRTVEGPEMGKRPQCSPFTPLILCLPVTTTAMFSLPTSTTEKHLHLTGHTERKTRKGQDHHSTKGRGKERTNGEEKEAETPMLPSSWEKLPPSPPTTTTCTALSRPSPSPSCPEVLSTILFTSTNDRCRSVESWSSFSTTSVVSCRCGSDVEHNTPRGTPRSRECAEGE